MAIPMMIGALFFFQKYADTNIEKAWTISLTTLAVFNGLMHGIADPKQIYFQMNPFLINFLVGATMIVILLQLFAVYNPFMHNFLHYTT